jgi:hypothetical protein
VTRHDLDFTSHEGADDRTSQTLDRPRIGR